MSQLTIHMLQAAYRSGEKTVRDVVRDIFLKISEDNDPAVFIHSLSADELEPYLNRIESIDIENLPLYGIPFVIKDNIDLAGVPTTAACPDYAYTPENSAFVVEQLIESGAIPIGKTNLDQFATGLVGVRSPYGIPQNPISPGFIPGGSSSGSAVAVARGYAAFSLGTDTAGSGRVPAAFNELVGLKPSRGLLSNSGVIPACKTLDCVSIFANNVSDAQCVFEIAAVPDAEDVYSRSYQFIAPGSGKTRIGILAEQDLSFFGNISHESFYNDFVSSLESNPEIELRIVDFNPFRQAASLLYQGPWVAERYAAIGNFLEKHPNSLHPVTYSIIGGAHSLTAVDAFKSFYKLQSLKKLADAELLGLDCILTPTTGTHYTVEEVLANPVETNTNLGFYTNFMNLLDYAAIAIPAGRTRLSLPFGVTLFSHAHEDHSILSIAGRLLGEKNHTVVTTCETDFMEIAVCGAHMEGLTLNHQLIELGASLVRKTKTAPCYQFFCLEHKDPIRPGMIRVTEGGSSIEMELWKIPQKKVGNFLSYIQEPLGLGSVELEDGRWVYGFQCEAHATETAIDITSFDNWRNYLKSIEN